MFLHIMEEQLPSLGSPDPGVSVGGGEMSAAPAFGVSPSDISSDNPPQNGGPSPKVASPTHPPLHTHLGRNGEMCANQKASMANGTTTTSNMGSGLEGGGAGL
ncbi:synaptic Ras GTPase activating protein 1b isoform X1 [Tachysurus ichikawai]